MAIIEISDGQGATIKTVPSCLMITLLEGRKLTRSIFTFGTMTQHSGESSNDHNVTSLDEQSASALRNGEVWGIDVPSPEWFDTSFLERVSTVLKEGTIREDLNRKAKDYSLGKGAKVLSSGVL